MSSILDAISSDSIVYGNMVSGIVYIVFTILLIVTITYPNANKNALTIVYQISNYILALMFLIFTIQQFLKYRKEQSNFTLKMLLLFGSLFLVYLNTGLTWTKQYYMINNNKDKAKNIEYANGIFTIIIGIFFMLPAMYNMRDRTIWSEQAPWLLFGISFIILGSINIYFSFNQDANLKLYYIPVVALGVSAFTFILKMYSNYINPAVNPGPAITTLRDSIMVLICVQVIIGLLKNATIDIVNETKTKTLDWFNVILLLIFSSVNLFIYKINPARPGYKPINN